MDREIYIGENGLEKQIVKATDFCPITDGIACP